MYDACSYHARLAPMFQAAEYWLLGPPCGQMMSGGRFDDSHFPLGLSPGIRSLRGCPGSLSILSSGKPLITIASAAFRSGSGIIVEYRALIPETANKTVNSVIYYRCFDHLQCLLSWKRYCHDLILLQTTFEPRDDAKVPNTISGGDVVDDRIAITCDELSVLNNL